MNKFYIAKLIIESLRERGGEANPVRLACDVANKTRIARREGKLPVHYNEALSILIAEQAVYFGPSYRDENPHSTMARLNSSDFVERFERIYFN